MNKKYINVALVLLSVALLAIVLLGYLGLKKALKNTEPTYSSGKKLREESDEIGLSSTPDSTIGEPPESDDTSAQNERVQDEASSNISPKVTSSINQQELPCPLNEEIESTSNNQNDLENEIQAEVNAQCEVLDENMPSEEETETGVKPEDARESKVTLENDGLPEATVSNPPSVDELSSSIQIIEEAGQLPTLVVQPQKYNLPAVTYEISEGYLKSSRGEAQIPYGINIVFYERGSIEIPAAISVKFDIMGFICGINPINIHLHTVFMVLPSGIYETIGGEYQFKDGSTFSIPIGIKIHIPVTTIIEYPRGLDIKSIIKFVFDFSKMKKESSANES